MLVASERADPRFSRMPDVQTAMTKAKEAWGHAAHMKPLLVSNQPGDGILMANHLASMGYYLSEAKAATLELADAIEALPAEDVESVASLDPALGVAAP